MYTKIALQPAFDPLDEAIQMAFSQELSDIEATPVPTRISLLLSRHDETSTKVEPDLMENVIRPHCFVRPGPELAVNDALLTTPFCANLAIN